jgi:zinc/manganese transport system substrate-binding protein
MAIRNLRLCGLALVMALVASACGGAQESAPTTTEAPAQRPSVVVTTSHLGDFVETVAADLVDLYVIAGPGVDAQTYEPSSEDITRLATADMIIRSGAGLEPWFDESVDPTFSGLTVDASRGVQVADRNGTLDPHIWMSPVNARQMVANITLGLSELLPNSATLLQGSERAFGAQLETMSLDIRRSIDTLNSRNVVTAHVGLRYFTDEFGLTFLGSANGSLNATATPTQEHTDRMVAAIQRENVHAVFAEASIPRDSVVALAEAADVRVVGGPDALHVDALGEEGSGAENYIDMMRQNANILVTHLGG